MSQNITKSQDQTSPTMSSLLMSLPMLLERMHHSQNYRTRLLGIIPESVRDFSLLYKSPEQQESTLSALLSDQALKLSLEISRLTLQLESLYVSQLELILGQSSTNTEQSNSSEKGTC